MNHKQLSAIPHILRPLSEAVNAPDWYECHAGCVLFLLYTLLCTHHPESHAVASIRAVSGRLRPPQLPFAADTAAQGDLRTPPYNALADSVLLSFPSPLTQRLRVIFGLLRITPSPLLISLTVHLGLVACELYSSRSTGQTQPALHFRVGQGSIFEDISRNAQRSEPRVLSSHPYL